MSTAFAWQVIAALSLVTAAIKGVGPLALGGREMPPRLIGVVALLAPALLAALVVTQALANGRHVGIGADTVGVAASGVALWRGAGILVAVGVAAGVTAGLRLAF
ncbi:MAG: branched-chain amino acid transporter [Solirubrobacterales bacterium]|jgi:branched-subunit amino acid transport protein|nr:branched-chain amino acid transporter [Solirubrobacterales bacterium]